MIRHITAVGLILGLTLLQQGTSHAQSTAVSQSHPLNVQQARALCARSVGVHPGIWVKGYYQVGAMSDGPFVLQGVLFSSSAVKLPVGAVPSSLAQRRGLPIVMKNTVRLTRAEDRAMRHIRPGNLVLGHGWLMCWVGHPIFSAASVQAVGR
jgi:hypothetical protein